MATKPKTFSLYTTAIDFADLGVFQAKPLS
jgi:hypothetical protein